MNVLGLETSCDETGVAIYNTEQGLLSHTLYSQVELHAEYGGVVPELASRDHVRKIIPLVKEALDQAQLQRTDIDAIAYTQGPGLAGALLTGAATARSLAWALDIPALGVHHMEGHLLAPMLEDEKPEFPFLALLVSGGHTQIIKVEALGQYELIGETIDDAAGEAFDKTAKLLGLGYPGGPQVARLAEQGESGLYQFPRPMTDRPGLDFSFSGLKTFTLTTWQKEVEKGNNDEQTKANICRAFQEAVIDTILIKLKRALKETGYKQLVIAGGVGANTQLRKEVKDYMESIGGKAFYPRPEFCTDNGAMIAFSGALRLQASETSDLDFQVKPRWLLSDL